MDNNKRLIVLIVTFCLCFWALFFTHEAYGNDKTGKEYSYNCVKTLSCNVMINDLTVQPKLFIGKSSFNGSNKPVNIAYKGNHEPTSMSGIWGTNWTAEEYSLWKCHSGSSDKCSKLEWNEYFDSMIYAPGVGYGEKVLSSKATKLGYPVDGGDRVSSYRHSFDISNLLQNDNLVSLKHGLVAGAEGNWLKELQADPFIFVHDSGEDYQAYGNSLNWFYLTIIPLLEAHIVLQRNEMYTQDEYELVHSWLEKRVWALEQGPMDGLLPSSWNWQLIHEPANHETVKKKVAYLLWGIADMNDTYFTAGLNGFEDFYSTMRRNGTFKNEHRKGNGENYGLSSGNEVGQAMTVMAIILNNQGIDVRKQYPKIEKFVEWASENYKDSMETGYTGGNSDMRFLSRDPKPKNTIGWMFLWDNVFGTNYAKNFDVEDNTKAMTTFGIVSPEDIIIN